MPEKDDDWVATLSYGDVYGTTLVATSNKETWGEQLEIFVGMLRSAGYYFNNEDLQEWASRQPV